MTHNAHLGNEIKNESAQQKNTLVPFDPYQLPRAHTQWQFGDWESLIQLQPQFQPETLQHHPERAQLALYAAAGHLQSGDSGVAKKLIKQAQEWGISKENLARSLISGAHNSLARVCALAGRTAQAQQHYEKAIRVAVPWGVTKIVTDARARFEQESMGLFPQSQGRLQQFKALASAARKNEQLSNSASGLRKVSEFHKFYINFAYKNKRVPFLLIDSKSLPRSGLHYLKNTLSKVFGECFSFCEWYQEPGCCKQMPCALTGFADHAKNSSQLRIRLIKSHDFQLTDPLYETNHYLQRLILVRDPLSILTSWFALEQLVEHKTLLAANGVNVSKIFLSHEKEVLTPAYQLIDEDFIPPSIEKLTDWLDEKSRYIFGFSDKYLKPIVEDNKPLGHVVDYSNIRGYIENLFDKYFQYLPDAVSVGVGEKIMQLSQGFKARKDPLCVESTAISDYMKSNSVLFKKTAERIVCRSEWRLLEPIRSKE